MSRILAVVTAKDDAKLELGTLREFCVDKIADYKAPHARVLHGIPRNPSGKIQKHVLRAELAAAGAVG